MDAKHPSSMSLLQPHLRQLACFVIALLLVSCASDTPPLDDLAKNDPFTGFFAHPNQGILELRQTSQGYVGEISVDFGPFPIQAQRIDNTLQGTVAIADRRDPILIEAGDAGLYVTVDGSRFDHAYMRFQNLAHYERWHVKHEADRIDDTPFIAPVD